MEIHPKVAEALDIADGDWVVVESASGQGQGPRAPGGRHLGQRRQHRPRPGPDQRACSGAARPAPPGRTIGANPYALLPARSEPLTGLAACLPARVRIRKA